MDRTPHKPSFQKEGQPSDMSAEAKPTARSLRQHLTTHVLKHQGKPPSQGTTSKRSLLAHTRHGGARMGKKRPYRNNLASATKTTKVRTPSAPPQVLLNLSEIGRTTSDSALRPQPPAPRKVAARNRWTTAHERTCLALPTHVMPGAYFDDALFSA